MKNFIFLTTILAFLFFSLNSYSVSAQTTCGQTLDLPLNGSTTINGIIVTNSANTGSIFSDNASRFVCVGVETIDTGSFFVGFTGSYSTTYTFSEPVNDLVFMIGLTGPSANENFIFTTDGGTTSISLGVDCGTESISGGNELISGSGGGSNGGGGILTVSAASPYTSLTVTGNGGANGSLIGICESFVGEPCGAGIDAPQH